MSEGYTNETEQLGGCQRLKAAHFCFAQSANGPQNICQQGSCGQGAELCTVFNLHCTQWSNHTIRGSLAAKVLFPFLLSYCRDFCRAKCSLSAQRSQGGTPLCRVWTALAGRALTAHQCRRGFIFLLLQEWEPKSRVNCSQAPVVGRLC